MRNVLTLFSGIGCIGLGMFAPELLHSATVPMAPRLVAAGIGCALMLATGHRSDVQREQRLPLPDEKR